MLDPTGTRDQAFTTHVLPEVEMLLRVATTLTARPDEAEALVQETLLRAYRTVDRFDGQSPRVWLLALMRQAKTTRHRGRAPRLMDEPDTGPDRLSLSMSSAFPEAILMGGVFDDAVLAELAALPERHRQVVLLVDMAGLSYAEAAVVLGAPRGMVKSRLHRARRRMRSHLAAASHA
ncbi:RNA polymerase sigma factor [Streptomyces canus]|uniref:RNA polymerase sigma factor n=1 Tax=Streptomyces canus TaxID=58343 RepID=UPI00381FBD04